MSKEIVVRKWTKEEVQFLKDHYPSKGGNWVSEQLEMVPDKVRRKAKELKIHVITGNHTWTENDYEFLKLHYSEKGPDWCSEQLKVSKQSLAGKASALNLLFFHWSSEEDEYMKLNYGPYGPKICAEHLNRNEDAICKRAWKLGLLRDNKHWWTESESVFIKNNYPIHGAEYVANELGLSLSCVTTKVSHLGLLKLEQNYVWTEENDNFLKEYFPINGSLWCADKLNIKVSSIKSRCAKLHLKINNTGWSQEDILFIKNNYKKIGALECAKHLKINLQIVYNITRDIEKWDLNYIINNFLPSASLHQWTLEEEEFLIKNYFEKNGIVLCIDHLKIGYNELKHKIYTLNLNNVWSLEEENYLIENYPSPYITGLDCAKFLNKNIASIREKVSELKLVKKHKVNPELFTNPNLMTKEAVYLLGFLWADGTIRAGLNRCGNTIYRVGLCIQKFDMDKILNVFETTGDWNKRNIVSKIEHHQEKTILLTHNKPLYEFLYDYGYHEKSFGATPDKLLNFIPEILHKFWYRGFHDGDGYTILKLENDSIRTKMGFSSHYDQDWNFMKTILDKLDLPTNIYQRYMKKGRGSIVVLHRITHVIKMGDYMYEDYELEQIGTVRKWLKYKELKQAYQNKLNKKIVTI